MMSVRLFWMACALLCAQAAVAKDAMVGSLHIEHPWTWNTPPGAKVGGAFMRLHNMGKTADRLVSAESPAAGKTEIHNHLTENGVMKMRAVPHIEMAPGQSVALKPGSFHIMFFDLKQTFKVGDRIPLTLTFEKAGKTTVEVMVEDRAAPPSNSEHSGHKH
jgi:periplasmic copper chaperone A